MSGADRLSDLRARASKGEWRVCDGHPIAYMGDDAVGEMRYVGTMGAMGDPEADAELMAAAPDLAYAAEGLRAYDDTVDGVTYCCLCDVFVGACSCPMASLRDALARLSGGREGADRG